MEEKRARELLSQVKEVYSDHGCRRLQMWIKNYEGENSDKEYLERIIEIILGINRRGPDSRIWSIDPLVTEEILFYTGFRTEIGKSMADYRKKSFLRDIIGN